MKKFLDVQCYNCEHIDICERRINSFGFCPCERALFYLRTQQLKSYLEYCLNVNTLIVDQRENMQ
jgi:hypothetical protein